MKTFPPEVIAQYAGKLQPAFNQGSPFDNSLMGAGNVTQQFTGDIRALGLHAGLPNIPGMISGSPMQGIVDPAATKRGDDGKKDGGDNLMKSSVPNNKS
jgi:hypothetical protein